MSAFGIRQSVKSIRLAKELTSIATNVDFGDLRTDMVTSRIIKETEDVNTGAGSMVEFVARLMGALEMVLVTVEVLADDIANESAAREALHSKAQEVADHPHFKERLEALARELHVLDEKPERPLRRLSIVDEQFREMDQ